MKCIIETERVFLRNFKLEDLDDLYEYASVSGVGEMAGWPAHNNIEETKTILEMFINSPKTFAIVLKSLNKVIGSFSVKEPSECVKSDFEGLNTVEIGYTIAKDFWGYGIVPELTKEVIKHLFTNENVDAITVEHFVENIQSKRVIEKCGGVFYKMDTYESIGLKKKFETKRYIIQKKDYKN